MKKNLCIMICFVFMISCVGCNSNSGSVALISGSFYAHGDYEEMMTPYLDLNTEERTFIMGPGALVSYAEYGTYRVRDGKIIATSQNTSFVFEIKNSKTLVLIDNGDNDYFKIPPETVFLYSEKLK